MPTAGYYEDTKGKCKMSANDKYVYVVTAESESSDHYGSYVYSDDPTDDMLRELAISLDSTEELDGPGDYGTYVYLYTEKCIIRKA